MNKIKWMLGKRDQDFVTAYNNINAYSKKIQAAHDEYKVQPLQSYMAAWCAAMAQLQVIIVDGL